MRDSTQACKLIPFQFSSTQTTVLEFCDETVRMQIGGATLLETGVAISSIAGSTVNTTGAHGFSSNQDVFIGTRFHRITVTGATSFTTADRWGAATTASGTTASQRSSAPGSK